MKRKNPVKNRSSSSSVVSPKNRFQVPCLDFSVVAGSVRANGRQGCIIGPSLELFFSTQEQTILCLKNIFVCLKTTCSCMDKLIPDIIYNLNSSKLLHCPLYSNHRDCSYTIEMACHLHGTKMTWHGLLRKGHWLTKLKGNNFGRTENNLT